MTHHVQNATNRFFPSVETSNITLNLKFFRGEVSEVTAAQLAEQVCLAENFIADGTAVMIDDPDSI